MKVKIPTVIGVVVVACVFVALGIRSTEKDEPSLSCTFSALPGQGPLRLGSLTGPIDRIELKASAHKSAAGGMYAFEGRSDVSIDGHVRGAKAHGDVFTADDNTIAGLLLFVEDSAFGTNGLRVATLDNRGQLDFDKFTAFAFTDPNFKRSHPLNFKCKTSQPLI